MQRTGFIHRFIYCYVCFFLVIANVTLIDAADSDDDLMFIHHSCGRNWLDDGLHDALLLKGYIDERNDIYYDTVVSPDFGRPDSLVDEFGGTAGDHTNMNHWVFWFNDYIDSVIDYDTNDGINRIIMFKSCYPISNIKSDGSEPGNPFDAVYPNGQSFVNYKAVYRHPDGYGNTYTYNGHIY